MRVHLRQDPESSDGEKKSSAGLIHIARRREVSTPPLNLTLSTSLLIKMALTRKYSSH